MKNQTTIRQEEYAGQPVWIYNLNGKDSKMFSSRERCEAALAQAQPIDMQQIAKSVLGIR